MCFRSDSLPVVSITLGGVWVRRMYSNSRYEQEIQHPRDAGVSVECYDPRAGHTCVSKPGS